MPDNKNGCTCSEMTHADEHPCPYQCDINNDEEFLCTCCMTCEHQCLMDI